MSNKGARGLTAVFDGLAGELNDCTLCESKSLGTRKIFLGFALANQLNGASVNTHSIFPTTNVVSVTETKQGLYKEYTVEKIDSSALDEVRRSYKTADETEESKDKVMTLTTVHR